MPPLQEIIKSLYGAYRLALRDGSGMSYFNVSSDGFLRSFFAALVIAPLYVTLLYMRYSAGEVSAPASRYIPVELVFFVISWALFPVVMLSVCRFLECGEKYFAYVIAYNWTSVLQNLLYIPLAMLSVAGALQEEAAGTLSFLILLLILVYSWFVARTALELPPSTAAAVVALDLVLGVFVSITSETML